MGDLVVSIVCKEVIREQVVREADDKIFVPVLSSDLGVQGCCQPQVVTLFDICVVDDTDDKSNVQQNVEAVLSSAEHRKEVNKWMQWRLGMLLLHHF